MTMTLTRPMTKQPTIHRNSPLNAASSPRSATTDHLMTPRPADASQTSTVPPLALSLTQTPPPLVGRRAQRWRSRLNELRVYMHTHANLPTFTHSSLGGWVDQQKVNYHFDQLAAWQIHLLNQIPRWTWAYKHPTFDDNVRRVEMFVCRNFRLPRVADGPIGVWLSRYRIERPEGDDLVMAHRGITEAQRLALETVVRNGSLDDTPSWQVRFNDVEWFAHEYGYIPRNGELPGLSCWVKTQRGAYRDGTLDERQIELLGALPGWTWSGRFPRPNFSHHN